MMKIEKTLSCILLALLNSDRSAQSFQEIILLSKKNSCLSLVDYYLVNSFVNQEPKSQKSSQGSYLPNKRPSLSAKA